MSTLVLQNKMYAPHLQELRQTLGASDQFTKKGPNKTLFEIENHASNIQNRVELYVLVKVFTSSVHLFPYHEGWGFYEIEVPLARKILMHMLATDLVYPTYRHMPDEQATSLIEQMLHFFSSNVRCFTNCQFDVDFTLNECEAKGINIFDHYSWAPFIMRTYNMGVVLVDEQNIGVLWRGTWIYRAPSFHFRSFPREISHPVWRGRDKLCLGWGRPRLEEITDHWLP